MRPLLKALMVFPVLACACGASERSDCEDWSLLGYRIGMPKEEALKVRRADETSFSKARKTDEPSAPSLFRVCPGLCRFEGSPLPPAPHFEGELAIDEGGVVGLWANLPDQANDLREFEELLAARLGKRRDLSRFASETMKEQMRKLASEEGVSISLDFWISEQCDTAINLVIVPCDGHDQSSEECQKWGRHARVILGPYSVLKRQFGLP